MNMRFTTWSKRLVAVVSVGWATACGTKVQAPSMEAAPNAEVSVGNARQFGGSQSALVVKNGLFVNGAAGNGLYVNGLSFNGLYANGLYVNGLPLNGLPLNGLYVNGLYVNGIGTNGLPLNGLPLNGLYVNGLPLNGLPVNGLPLNGLYVNGLPLNGLYVNGLPLNGLSLNGLNINGLYVNGLYVNGLPVNGLYVNGMWPNGLYVNGLPLNGVALNGLRVNGSDPTTAIKVADANGQLLNLSADQEASFESMLGHLVWCALPARDSVAIYNAQGRRRTYSGYHGLAPSWKTSGLLDDPSGIDANEELRWCVEHYRTAVDASTMYEGVALNASQLESLEVLLTYTISCALNDGDSVVVDFPSGQKTFYGALGLAPGWKDGPLDEPGQKAVSACLGARTNATGSHVRISLRNPGYPALTVSKLESMAFKTHEGAFWGNLFGSSPAIHACKVEGGGPAGRLCTDGSCGFTPDPLPACDDVAAGGCQTKDAEGNWTNCGPEGEVEVLNTFLMTEKKRTTGMNHTCKTENGEVFCWGNGASGKLGIGTTDSTSRPYLPVMGLPDNTQLENLPLEVDVGPDTSCTRLRSGEIWCWGGNQYGQLANGTTMYGSATALQISDLGPTVADLAMGFDVSCALRMDGTVWCWGTGYVGNGTAVPYLHPVQAGETVIGNEAVQVVVGAEHACVLKMDGTVWCWGSNMWLELGAPGYSEYTPIRVGEAELGNRTVRLYTQVQHTCALRDDDTLWCWGVNMSDQCGVTGSLSTGIVQVAALGNDVQEAALGSDHSCALKHDGTVWCWGWNGLGQFGSGNQDSSVSPVQMILPGPAASIDATHGSTYATLEDGTVWATGDNGWSQLTEDGTLANIYTPMMVFDPATGTSGTGEGSGDGGAPPGSGGSTSLINPDFDVDLTGWEASESGVATHETRNCRTGTGCAMLSSSTTASFRSTTGVRGALMYTVSAWLAGTHKRNFITTQIRIVERDALGAFVAESTSIRLLTRTNYGQISVSHDLSSDLNEIFVEIDLLEGDALMIDDVVVDVW
ncbi:MAG: hypothetical protein IPK13_13825 [Deltaproteobacteria bacterium]|nr:hypothetical protein [Deltaproteobacteria bacterium]